MIWIALTIAGFSALLFAGAAFGGGKQARNLGFLGVVGAAGAFVASLITIIPAGHVGVPVVLGNVSDNALEQGLNLKHPFANIVKFSVRVQTYTMASAEGGMSDPITALSSDGMRMPLDVTIAYRLVGADAPWVYEKLGSNYQHKIIRTAARTAVREAVSKFTSQEAYATKREELATVMESQLRTRLQALLKQQGFEGQAILIEQVMLRNVDLPPRVKDAIEEKLSAEQEALKMAFVLDRERQEAERKRIEASGIRDFQAIVREGIDDELLRWKGIEATKELAESPNAKIVIVGGKDGLPLILNTDGKQ
jgi:regulator of protease activity HflC (stomatin/prohibitin superfamily)